MAFSFLITLLASWLSGPLSILVAGWLNLASAPALIAGLLAGAAMGPVQMLLNESVAARVAVGMCRPSPVILGSISALQGGVCAISLYSAGIIGLRGEYIFWLSILTAITSWINFEASLAYYRIAVSGPVGHVLSAFFGSAPSVILVFIYLSASSLQSVSVLRDVVLSTMVFMPSVVVFLVLRSRVPPKVSGDVAALASRLNFRLFLFAALALIFVSFSMNSLRARLAFSNPDYAAYVIVALNAVTSVLLVITRAFFMRAATRRERAKNWTARVVPFTLAFGIFSLLIDRRLADLCFLVTAQATVLAVVEHVRRAGLRPG